MNILNKVKGLFSNLVNKNPSEHYPHVKVISHHIPKTAGTSLRLTLQQSFGKERIYGLYDEAEISSNGGLVWVPRKAEIIHGHVRPHKIQSEQFCNAKRIVWLRDPIARCLSQLQHILEHKQPLDCYEHIHQHYLQKECISIDKLFIAVLNDNKLKGLFHVYSGHFPKGDPFDYQFIGKVENYLSDLEKLSEVLGKKLSANYENPSSIKLSQSLSKATIKQAKEILAEEYEVYESV